MASNYCFSHRNVFQNGVNTLSKMVNHFFFLSKSLKFCLVLTIRFCSNFIISNYFTSKIIIFFKYVKFGAISLRIDIFTRNQFDMYSFVSQSWCAFWQKNDMLLKWSILKSTSESKSQRKAYHLKDTALLCDF